MNSAELTESLRKTNFSDRAATVIGYGNMGRQFVKALQALGVKRIRVCTQGSEGLTELATQGVGIFPGGYEHWSAAALPDELVILALPILKLIDAAKFAVSHGFRKLLIEKPVSLWASKIGELKSELESMKVDAVCGYNRVAYPSFIEARSRSSMEEGITSCSYTFTEFISKLNPRNYQPEEMERWGIANSLHVMAMAHGLVGLPGDWHGFRTGSTVAWHPSGSVFVGSGLSESHIPFVYHADWGSTGRWSIEVNTAVSSYRLCPLERLFRKTIPTADWEEVPVSTFAPDVKVGFAEQVAAMLDDNIRNAIPLVSLNATWRLTRFAEEIFGYSV